MMKVGIEILTGRFFYAEVDDEATVGGLKREIARREEELEEARLLLMHSSGRLLKDDNSALASYGCCDGSIVYLFFLPVGASPWPKLFEDSITLHIREG